jgi:thiosulfate/3-mercaptopyruvate sulfurtransferase
MTQPGNLIDGQELERRLDRADIRVVDCRFDLSDPLAGRNAFAEGHIRGAVYADLDADLSAPIGVDTGRHPLPDADVFAATMGRLGIDRETDVVVYDDGPGALAARAWWLLRWMGHDRVRLLDGGFQQWLADARPCVAGEEVVAPRVFFGQPRFDRVVNTSELVANLHTIEQMNLVDARDFGRFRGEVEPIDAVAGHIPGSRNLPFTLSLNSNGRWREPAELESLWASALGEDRSTPWIAMCGSGVTACHLAISALEAGYQEPRLYVGSWSEWIRDPSRPVALGDGAGWAFGAADLS